ncbi:hypothetical protein ACP4OV_029144 [Aristida adscensionis]
MSRIKRRQRRIAPALIGPDNTPVTTTDNPVTGPSCYMIKVTDDTEPLYSVDMMIRDTDSYLLGFRRQIRENENSHCEGNTWFRYSNEKLPPCIHDGAIDLGFRSSHADLSQTLPGRPAVVHNMFHVLAGFEDCPRDERTQRVIDPLDLERVKPSLSVAIVMFGEGTRLRSISNEIEGRLSGWQNSTELSACQWTAIKGWGQGSSHALDMFTVMDTATGALRSLNTVSDVIGDEGEFMLLRLSVNAKNHMIDPAARGRLEQQLRQGKIPPIPEPGFGDEEEEEEEEEDI